MTSTRADAERFARVMEIFNSVCDLPAGEVEQRLGDLCGLDTELSDEVRALLEAERDGAGRFEAVTVEDGPLGPQTGTNPSATTLRDGASRSTLEVGPYRLLQKLGEGGMGEVWEAEQIEPVRRRVAFKVIKRGMDTKAVIARFEIERQALAMMDHPAIARVFDAGETPMGRPYFVMELVHGIPITDFCDTHSLSNPERIELFQRVCEGVQHAHQKAIIHRDLKPSNVLVAVQNGKPVPKIIDFGVAKATSHPLTERTMVTMLGGLIGTLEYMSPEQAEMNGEGVDTRTDVYSLGVILYELLTGCLPFDSETLRSATFDEARRLIREDNPPRPSTRVTRAAEETTSAAAKRGTSPGALGKQLAGDLDWIVLKALEKDRLRRYGSPQELVSDLDRHLSDHPVIARPPSTTYRVRKFVSRHRAGVLATTIVSLALVAGTVGTGIGLFRAREAEALARESEARALDEAERAATVSSFLVDLFEVSDAPAEDGVAVSAAEVLERGARRIRDELSQQPELQARLMETVGTGYEKLGLYRDASELLEKALAVREGLSDADGLEVASTLDALGRVYRRQGRYEETENVLQRSLAIRHRVLDPSHPGVATSLNNLANLYYRQGRYPEAESLHRQALEIRQKSPGPEDYPLAQSLGNLGLVLAEQGRYSESEPLLRRSLLLREQLFGPEHPRVAATLNSLAVIRSKQERLPEAALLYQRSLRIYERALGRDHPNVAVVLNNLGGIHFHQEEFAEAKSSYVRALEILEKTVGPNHIDVARALGNLGEVHWGLEEYPDAERLYLRARDTVASVDSRHPEMAHILHGLANVYRDQSRTAEAELLYVEALGIREEALGRDHPDLVGLLRDFATLLRTLERTAAAEELDRRALQIEVG